MASMTLKHHYFGEVLSAPHITRPIVSLSVFFFFFPDSEWRGNADVAR